jgi:acyl carrier protein
MDSSAPSATPTASNDAANTLVRHFTPEVRDAYSRFTSNRDPADADTVVVAVVLDHMPDKKRRPVGSVPDASGLITDLGFDSIAITEMVFFLEDLFHVRISNDEILRVHTVGDLRAFVRQKLATNAPNATA